MEEENAEGANSGHPTDVEDQIVIQTPIFLVVFVAIEEDKRQST